MDEHSNDGDGYVCPAADDVAGDVAGDVAEAPADELAAKRHEKSDDAIAESVGRGNAIAAQQMLGLLQMRRTQEFADWMRENMPYEAFRDQANSFNGAITGAIIGAWLECGATPEMLKEYFSRFVDYSAANYEATMRAMQQQVPEGSWICPKCGFPNLGADADKCAKCDREKPNA